MTAAEAVEYVRATLAGYRYTYGNELELHHGIAAALAAADIRALPEHRISVGRVDFYLPDLRVAIEVKIAGAAGDVARQLARYATCGDVDGLILVTSRVRHHADDVGGKPAAVVYLGLAAL